MSFLSKLASHDPVVRMLSGDHNDHNDSHGGGAIRLGYPMMPGETVSSVANRLRIPVDELLSSNPTLNRDTPLTPGLDIHLPTRNLDQTLSNIVNLNAHDTAPPDAPTPLPSSGSHELPVAPTLPGNLRDTVIAAVNDLGNIGSRDPSSVLVGTSATTIAAAAAELDSSRMLSSYALANNAASTPVQAATAQVVPTQLNTPNASNVYALPGNARTGAANDEPMHTLSFNQAASTTITNIRTNAGGVQTQNNGELPPPPPMPPSSNAELQPLFNTSSVQTSWAPQSVPSAWNTVVDVVDGSQAKLQIIAMMAAAQMEGAAAAGGAATGQTPGFIDPQALAAYATRANVGRTIDLGSGRSLQFTLVADPLRRVGAIGEEQRSAATGTRRTGDGLDQIPQDERTEADEETQDGHQERNHERRRLATIAALRRRRRPLSTRCRYREGERRPLNASGGRYPGGVDLAEFRSRMPQRYLWGSSPKGDRPKGR